IFLYRCVQRCKPILFTVLAVLLSIGYGYSQQVQVKGLIQDAQGEALPGVSVQEKGTTNGTTSDGSGRFGLQARLTAVIEFSYVGYPTIDVKLDSLQPD